MSLCGPGEKKKTKIFNQLPGSIGIRNLTCLFFLVNRMYFMEKKIFIEFATEGDLFVFDKYHFHSKYYKTYLDQKLYNNGTDVSTAVLNAIAMGQTKSRGALG